MKLGVAAALSVQELPLPHDVSDHGSNCTWNTESAQGIEHAVEAYAIERLLPVQG